jgi:hypothetical protein
VKLSVSLLAAALLASAPLHAQEGKDADKKGPEAKPPAARRFDCSRAKDPKGCEERVAKMREALDKARKACEGKKGEERAQCMEKSFCTEAKDPAKCEANLKERAERRREMREACKDKKGDELKECVREFRRSRAQGKPAAN